MTRLPQVTPQTNTNFSQTHSWAVQSWVDQNWITTPELGPVRFWSPKSSSFSGSDSIVVEEAAKKLSSPRPSVNKSGAPNFFIEHDKLEDSKLLRYLETYYRTVSTATNVLNDSITFFWPTGKASNITTWACAVGFPYPPSIAQYSGNESSCNLVYRTWP